MKNIQRFFVICLLTLILTACASFIDGPTASEMGTASPTPSNPTPEPTETPAYLIDVPPESLQGVIVQVWHSFSGSAATLFSTQLAEFNGANEWGIVVQQNAAADFRTLYELIDEHRAMNLLPDILVLLPEVALSLQDDLIDLNPYISDVQYGLTNDEIADIPAIFWEQDEVDGFRYGVPAQRTARFLLRNQTWADELGFYDIPDDAASFRQQACAGNQAKREDEDIRNDGYGGWVVDVDLYGSLSWMLAFGGGVVDDGTVVFSNQANEAALEFLKDLYDSDCAYNSTEPLLYTPLATRSALFASADLGEFKDVSRTFEIYENSDSWTVLPYPGSEPALVAHGTSYTILRSNEERQLAAWLFIRWLLSAENQTRWVEKTGLFPLRSSSLDMLSEYRTSHPQWAAAVDLLPLAHGAPQLASWAETKFILGDGVSYIFRMDVPEEQIIDVLTDMDALADELLSK